MSESGRMYNQHTLAGHWALDFYGHTSSNPHSSDTGTQVLHVLVLLVPHAVITTCMIGVR